MKNFCLILLVPLLLVSCSNNDDTPFDINGTFSHILINCESLTVSEKNCSEIIWFNDDDSTKASITYGGLDYGIPVTYKLENNELHFYFNNGNELDFSFEIIDENTLKQIDNNNLWLKDK